MEPLISARDLKKNFGKVEALKGVSLDVAEGEKVVVIGPSGSGKSVLIRSINGLERPDSGELTVNGIDMMAKKVDTRKLASEVAMVFQGYNLYPHKTVLENGGFDLALCSFQMDVVPDVGFFLRKGNDQNYGRYNSSEMTSLIDTLRTQENQADFAYTSQAIQQQFAADVPFICLFYRTGAILTRKMFTTVRSIREFELLRGIEAFGR